MADRPVPARVQAVLARRRSGAAGTHRNRAERRRGSRSAARAAAIREHAA